MNSIQAKINSALDKHSKNVAIEYLGQDITYEQLDKKSNAVANYLINMQIKQNEHIGVLTEDKYKSIYVILGILKANCIFVNLDFEYPSERLELMLSVSDTNIIFTDKEEKAEKLFGNEDIKCINLNCIDDDENSVEIDSYDGEDPIYIFFTSGTTGKPKGVLGKNKSLLHYIEWEIGKLNITEGCKVAQFTSQCHDPYLRDILVPLLIGGTICIPENKEVLLSSVKVGNWIEKSNINLIHCTPSFFKIINSNILSSNSFNSLKYILLAGEKIIPKDLKSWYECFSDRIQLVNLYGPTETTLAKTFYFIKPEDVDKNNIPVGKPIDGCRIAIMGKNDSMCVNGEIGEIIIRTPYRTCGYYKDDETNKKRFIPNPFGSMKDDIVYKTGDLGRILSDGNIELIGRKDRQIKIRGYRVEPEECEQYIVKYPDIKECAVIYKNRKDNKEVRKCVKCGIPSDYPGTKVDQNGICNYCNFYEQVKEKSNSYFKNMDALKNKFEKLRNPDSEYDCLFLYSGGKDSTYALCKLVEMNLRVLAFTFDNGFISEKALSNIKNVVKDLKVDHVCYSYENMKQIFVDGLNEESSVCNGCFKVLRILSTKLAYEKNIKAIVTGFSRGQIFDLRLYNILKQGIYNLNDIQEKIFEQRVLYHSKEDYVTRRMKESEKVTADMLRKIELIDFYRYTGVKNEDIYKYLEENIDVWKSPKDTGACSSNCLINDLGIYAQKEKYGYDNYTFPRSWEVRVNHINLEDAHKEDESKINTSRLEDIMNKLDYHIDIKGNNIRNGELVAYYTSDIDIKDSDIEKFAHKYLPEYMIPQEFIRIDKLTMTANGKTDYKALELRNDVIVNEYVAPRDEIERKLEKIWCRVLDREKVSIKDSFLKLGGSSLNIMSLISDIYEEFDIEILITDLFNNSTIEDIAMKIKNEKGYSIQKSIVAPKEYYEASSTQKRMYTLSLLRNIGTAYNIPFSLILEGNIDINKIEKIFNKITERHESLRTSFYIINNKVVQKIHEKVDFKINYTEFDEEEIEIKILDIIKPFNLSDNSLFRVTIAKLKEEKYLMLFDIHHIIADGASVNVIINEFKQLYEGIELEPLTIQYNDYSNWQKSNEFKEVLDKQQKYWVNKFKDNIISSDFPTDFPLKRKNAFSGDILEFNIDEKLTMNIRNIVNNNNSTIFTLLMSVYYLLIKKYTEANDITIGIPSSGRTNPVLNDQVGVFINTLPIRNKIMEDDEFKDFLDNTKDALNEGYLNQDYQLDMLIEKLGISTGGIKNPLFNTIFVMQMEKNTITNIGDIKISPYKISNKTSKFPISLYAEEDNNKINFYFEYNDTVYRRETIEQFKTDYINLLYKVDNNIKSTIKEILSE